jgi:hypothetical protein
MVCRSATAQETNASPITNPGSSTKPTKLSRELNTLNVLSGEKHTRRHQVPIIPEPGYKPRSRIGRRSQRCSLAGNNASCAGPPSGNGEFCRRMDPPNSAFDAGLRAGPFPDKPPACYRASGQLPGFRFTPAGNDELTMDQLLNKHLRLWARVRSEAAADGSAAPRG